jgi:hypothetical protein
MKARLHPHWVGGNAGYRYSVLFDGELLVERSRDPECDAARALLARGITGKLTLCDGKTGVPRMVIDIERAARFAVKEGPCVLPVTRAVPTHHTAPKRVRLKRREAARRLGCLTRGPVPIDGNENAIAEGIEIKRCAGRNREHHLAERIVLLCINRFIAV